MANNLSPGFLLPPIRFAFQRRPAQASPIAILLEKTLTLRPSITSTVSPDALARVGLPRVHQSLFVLPSSTSSTHQTMDSFTTIPSTPAVEDSTIGASVPVDEEASGNNGGFCYCVIA
ncbi:hypothetical protein CONPUDRAFT_162985 [Coniophora puteana RWD-64-598 SS2]|uniref:Uncharacterized protein n=1 Tax=Coniophora puteana (strain RWD-64-598) TaxID=741705 RepID=A0A5M3MX31_CONPW|nr:uncharacterized protein CONPUDRAFT_162985 [Coniophora puteana RWD-64-598 SS2]EIW83630.1 hypothetical protein CONPUDRAFT_162985 [Coniophora puteana RWD-64-598 SS2]